MNRNTIVRRAFRLLAAAFATALSACSLVHPDLRADALNTTGPAATSAALVTRISTSTATKQPAEQPKVCYAAVRDPPMRATARRWRRCR